jgi:O-antigen/teichoic acid export membrane protein
MGSVRRALALSLLERYLMLALALASNIIIARLLTPEQIGVYSVSLAVIAIAQALRDFGVGNYLIQERSLGDEKIGTAYGISLLLGGLLFAATFAGAPLAAHYYNEPRMATMLRISSLNFLLLPFCTVSLALLRREMRFRQLLHVTLSSALLGALTSIGLALLDFGANSLVIGSVVSNLATGAGAWISRPDRRLLRPTLVAWRSVLKFGGQSSLTGLITSVSMDASDLFAGKVLGFEPVAIISRAQGLMNLFNRDLMAAVRNVALPAFANAHRDGQTLQGPYSRSVALVAVFGWPFHALMSIYALEIVHLLYGTQWHAAARLVPIFCLSGAVAAVNALTPNLLVALGRIDMVTRVEIMMQPMRVVLVIAALLIFRSVEACAMAYLVSSIVASPVFWWFKNRGLGRDNGGLGADLVKSALVTLVVAVPPLIHVALVGFGHLKPIAIWQWIPVAGLGVLLGIVAVAALGHPLAGEALFLRFAGPLKRWIPPDKSTLTVR